MVIPPGTAGEKAGEQLLGDRACTACHKLGDRDGGIAPDLSYEGLIRDDRWLGDHFVNPRSRIPDSIMPAFRFPAEDFQRLSAYLVSLKTPLPPTADAKTTFTNLCARCHGEKGDGAGKVAWYIDPSPRDFTKPGFMASKPRTRFVASIEEGVGGTSMPPWKRILKEEQIEGVLDYVMQNFAKEPFKQLKARNIPEKNPVASSPDSIARGEQVFELRCKFLSKSSNVCPSRPQPSVLNADLFYPISNVDTNSLDIFPHPRNFRNHWFVESVPDRRLFESIEYGVQGTAMPSWMDMLSTNEVGDVINFIRSLQSGRN